MALSDFQAIIRGYTVGSGTATNKVGLRPVQGLGWAGAKAVVFDLTVADGAHFGTRFTRDLTLTVPFVICRRGAPVTPGTPAAMRQARAALAMAELNRARAAWRISRTDLTTLRIKSPGLDVTFTGFVERFDADISQLHDYATVTVTAVFRVPSGRPSVRTAGWWEPGDAPIPADPVPGG